MSGTRTILIIDYDPESIESTRAPLVKAGFEVEVANDGVEGLEAFRRLNPDLVLIEPMVPKKHGFRVCQEIKASPAGRATPVLITTAFYRGRKHRLEAQQQYGCDAYLEKPFAEDLLLSTCRRFLIDTQEPPLPPGDVANDAQVAEAPSAPPDERPRALVNSMPDLPLLEDGPPSRLPALDDLSEEEIQARLDAMILEDEPGVSQPAAPASAPVDRPPTQVSPAPRPSAPPRRESISAPGVIAPPSTPAAAGSSPAPRQTRPPAPAQPASVLSSPVPDMRLDPGPAAPAVGRTAARPAALGRPTVATAGRVRKIAVDSEKRSRMPLWIGVAAAVCIATGAGLLWLLRGQGTQALSAPVELSRAAESRNRPSAPPQPVIPTETDLETAAVEGSSGEATVANSVEGDVPAGSEIAASRAGEPETTPTKTSSPARGRAAEPGGKSRGAAEHPPAKTGDRRTAEPKAALPKKKVETATPPPASDPRTTQAHGAADKASERDGGSVDKPSTSGPSSGLPPSAPAGKPTTEPAAAERTKIDEPRTQTPPATAESPEREVTPATVEPSSQPEPETAKVRPGELVELGAVDSAPVAKHKPMPTYPPAARLLRQQGSVTLRLLVDEKGRVERAEVDSGSKNRQLQRAAIEAAEQWIFEPATKDDVPVKVWVTATFNFSL